MSTSCYAWPHANYATMVYSPDWHGCRSSIGCQVLPVWPRLRRRASAYHARASSTPSRQTLRQFARETLHLCGVASDMVRVGRIATHRARCERGKWGRRFLPQLHKITRRLAFLYPLGEDPENINA